MFGGMFICFSNILLSIFRVKHREQMLTTYEPTSLFNIRFLLGSLIKQPVCCFQHAEGNFHTRSGAFPDNVKGNFREMSNISRTNPRSVRNSSWILAGVLGS